MSAIRLSAVCAAGLLGVSIGAPALALDPSAIEHEVAGMNASLPAMVSPVLREEPIRFNGAELDYTFTRVGHRAGEPSAPAMAANARRYLLQRLCDDPDTRQMMRDGIVFSFGYVDDANVDANRVLINESDCAVLVK